MPTEKPTTIKLETQSREFEAEIQEAKTDIEKLRLAKELELFKLSFDTTGAKRREELTKDLGKELENPNVNEQAQYLLVNLGQLDRANKEGGYKEGDNALKKLAIETEKVILHNIKLLYRESYTKQGFNPEEAESKSTEKISEILQRNDKTYDIYRYWGSDFFVRINLPEDIRDEAESSNSYQKIQTQIGEIVIKPVDKDTSPNLTINTARISNAELHRLVETAEKPPDDPDSEPNLSVRRKFETLYTYLDLESRSQTIINTEKQLKGLPQDVAEYLYSKYLKKVFGPNAPTLEEIRNRGEEDTIKYSIETILETGKQRLQAARKTQSLVEQGALEAVLFNKYQISLEELRTPLSAEDIKIRSNDTERITVDELSSRTRALPETDGYKSDKKLTDLQEKVDELKHALSDEEYRPTQNDIEVIIQTIQSFQDSEYLSKYLTETMKTYFAATGIPESERHTVFRNTLITLTTELGDILEIQKKIDAYRHDSLTGLLNRGEYYKEAERLIDEGKNPHQLFVDMGFLKYFNTGGREVGNYAIQASAAIMQSAVESLGYDKLATVYRYGGDEFVILINGATPGTSEKITREILARIEENRKHLGPIPATDKSDEMYRSIPLSFNYGSSDIDQAKQIAEATNRSVPGSIDTSPNGLAEIQTILSDISVEEQKMRDRLKLFFDLTTIEELDQKWLSYFYSFSSKALGSISLEEIQDLKEQVSTGAVSLERYVHSKLFAKYLDEGTNEREFDRKTFETTAIKIIRSQLRRTDLSEHDREWYLSQLKKVQN